MVDAARHPSLRLIVTPLLGLLLVTAFVVEAGSSASASTTLPFDVARDVLVDEVTGQTFVSGASAVVALDAQGLIVQTIELSNGSGAAGMAISGSELFVALSGSNVIDVIDTGTLSEIDVIALPEATASPRHLAFSGGSLWVSWGTCGLSGGLASVDMSSHETDVYTWPEVEFLPADCAVPLVPSPAQPDRIFLWNPNTHPTSLVMMDTSAAPPVADGSIDDVYEGFADVALSTDGSRLYAARNARVPILEYTVSNLTPTGREYDIGVYDQPIDIDVSSTGEIIVATTGRVLGFRPWSQQPFYREPIAGGPFDVSADGTKMFLANGFVPATLNVLFPLQRATRLTLSVNRKTIDIGDRVRLVAHLEHPAETIDRSVTIFAKRVGGETRVLKSGVIDASGDLVARTEPRKNTSYWAGYAGDLFSQDDVSGTVEVGVRVRLSVRMDGYYARSGGYHLFRYRDSCPTSLRRCPVFIETVAPNHTGKEVTYRIQAWVTDHWTVIFGGHAQLPPTGPARIVLVYADRSVIGERFRIRGGFEGDRDHLGTTSGWLLFRVTP